MGRFGETVYARSVGGWVPKKGPLLMCEALWARGYSGYLGPLILQGSLMGLPSRCHCWGGNLGCLLPGRRLRPIADLSSHIHAAVSLLEPPKRYLVLPAVNV